MNSDQPSPMQKPFVSRMSKHYPPSAAVLLALAASSGLSITPTDDELNECRTAAIKRTKRDAEAAAVIRAERARRKAENYAKRQPKATT